MLKTSNLEYYYNKGNVLRFPDIQCEKGEHWLLLGQSGSGKTTLLHLLGGLMPPSKGSIHINEKPIHNLSTSSLDQFRGKNIGIVFQKPHFIKSLTVKENLALAQSLAGEKVNKNRISEILERLNLGHKLNVYPDALSQGEAQRVAIARALNRPPH